MRKVWRKNVKIQRPEAARYGHGRPLAVALTVARDIILPMQLSITRDKYKGHAKSPWRCYLRGSLPMPPRVT